MPKIFAYTTNPLENTYSVYHELNGTGVLSAVRVVNSLDPFYYLVSLYHGLFLVASGGVGAFSGLCEYSIDPKTGVLGPGFYQPCLQGFGDFGFTGLTLISDSSIGGGPGDYLYAVGATQGTSAIGAFRVAPTGELTEVGSPFTSSAFPSTAILGPLAIDPSGHYVYGYTSALTGNFLFAIVRNSDGSLGSLAPGSPVSTGTCVPYDDATLILDPQGKNLFLNCTGSDGSSDNRIQVYSVNNSNGQLALASTYQMATVPWRVSIDQTGWYVFTADLYNDQVEMLLFDRPSRTLTAEPGSPYPTDRQPNTVAVDPTNHYVYVTNGGRCFPAQISHGTCTDDSAADVNGFRLNYKQHSLTPLHSQPFGSGRGTRTLIFVRPY